MNDIERKLQRVIYAFIVSVIIIVAAFAAIIYYYETKEISRFGVSGQTMFAKAFVDKNVGTAPLAVNFSSLIFNVEGSPKYHWDFGDGNTSNVTNPTHNYTKKGNYTCNLTIIDEAGRNITASVEVIVMANNPPTVVVLVDKVESNRPHIPVLDYMPDPLIYVLVRSLDSAGSHLMNKKGWINVQGQVFDPEGDEIVSYEWELTQPPFVFLGTTQYPKFYFSGKEELANFTIPELYTYRWLQYSIKLTVTDSAGNKASDIKTFGVSASDVILRRGRLINKWNNFWNVRFYSMPTSLQDSITAAMWRVLDPAKNTTDRIINKIISPLPDSLKNIIIPLYESIWQTQEKKYRRPNNAPTVPTDPNPEDNATGADLYANLNWTCTDPDNHPLTYDIYFGTSSPPPLVKSNHQGTTYDLEGVTLQEDTTYYWKIVAHDSPPTGKDYVKTSSSPIWSFTTKSG